MKLFTTLLFLLAAINISSQTLYENFGERVFLNKKIISYTIYQKKIKNGIADEGKTNNPNENNPYNISISSNEKDTSSKLIPFETTSQDFQMKTTGIRPQTKIIMIADTPLLPINGVKHKNPLNFSQDICNFTEHGRSKIHEEIALVTKGEIQILLEYKDTTKSVEFNDNRISVFIAQQGNCYITNRRHSPTDMVCIYKNITETDRDKYQNLVFVEIPISKAILTESFSIKNPFFHSAIPRLSTAGHARPIAVTIRKMPPLPRVIHQAGGGHHLQQQPPIARRHIGQARILRGA